MEEFMSSADVAKLVGITPASVREAAITKRLPVAAVTEGGMRLFRRSDAEQYKREREARRRI